MSIFFTSDTHFGHKNIVRGTSTWTDPSRCRDFDNMDEHNNRLVEQINAVVGTMDTLYHLGDWSFGGIENIWNFRKRINCQTIHLILGNHDHHIRADKELPNYNSEGSIFAQEIFASVSDYKEVKLHGKYFVLSHYAHRVWNGSHKGIIHLYGHSHGTIPDYGKSMDVGVDTNNLKPYSFNEIITIMESKGIEFPDHHDINTNWK